MTSTRGLGELMLRAYEAGARRVVLGLGGSSTNDAGCGMAHALGWKFLDKRNASFCPMGGTLGDIARIVPPEVPFQLPVTAACDVRAPLFGPQGAAYVYAPQKGADAAMVQRLDQGLRQVSGIRIQEGGEPDACPLIPASCPGDGAAGGLGFGVRVFCGGALRTGVDMLLDQAGFGAMLDGADLVITGEGRMDAQTTQGKAPWGVLLRARAKGAPVIGICGCLGRGHGALLEAGFAAIYPAAEQAGASDLETLRAGCRGELYRAAGRAAREWHSAQCT
jgi:glycerate kinase